LSQTKPEPKASCGVCVCGRPKNGNPPDDWEELDALMTTLISTTEGFTWSKMASNPASMAANEGLAGIAAETTGTDVVPALACAGAVVLVAADELEPWALVEVGLLEAALVKAVSTTGAEAVVAVAGAENACVALAAGAGSGVAVGFKVRLVEQPASMRLMIKTIMNIDLR
jgi:hypothetical protein